MTIQIPPAPTAAQVPEHARRFEDLKIRVHGGRSADQIPGPAERKGWEKMGRKEEDKRSPRPAVKAPRVRPPQRRRQERSEKDPNLGRDWALRSAGIALVASLSVSILANVMLIGFGNGYVPMGISHLGSLVSGMGWR